LSSQNIDVPLLVFGFNLILIKKYANILCFQKFTLTSAAIPHLLFHIKRTVVPDLAKAVVACASVVIAVFEPVVVDEEAFVVEAAVDGAAVGAADV
jgi:hypothetical protein